MKRWTAAVLSVALGAVGFSARAGRAAEQPCASKELVIISRSIVSHVQAEAGPGVDVAGPAANPNAAPCALAPDQDTVDTRFLLPGANQLTVRYTPPDGAVLTDEELAGTLDGLGFDHTAITLQRRVVDRTGSGDPKFLVTVYDMASFVPIPAGPLGTGSVTATIMVGATPVSVTFHTVAPGA